MLMEITNRDMMQLDKGGPKPHRERREPVSERKRMPAKLTMTTTERRYYKEVQISVTVTAAIAGEAFGVTKSLARAHLSSLASKGFLGFKEVKMPDGGAVKHYFVIKGK